MKKVLFGIMALSAVTFANNNPGTETGASVPVLVKAEIVEPSDSIQITDLSGRLLSQIELDHGRLVKGAATASSVVYQDFKVVKGDGSGGLADLSPAGKSAMAVSIDNTTTTLNNKTTPGSTPLESNLSLLGGKDTAVSGNHGYEVDLATGIKEHVGRIYSELTPAVLNAGEVGVHDNGSDTILTVLYTPVKP